MLKPCQIDKLFKGFYSQNYSNIYIKVAKLSGCYIFCFPQPFHVTVNMCIELTHMTLDE